MSNEIYELLIEQTYWFDIIRCECWEPYINVIITFSINEHLNQFIELVKEQLNLDIEIKSENSDYNLLEKRNKINNQYQ